MLSIESLIKVSDNSGAKNAKCIKVFGSLFFMLTGSMVRRLIYTMPVSKWISRIRLFSRKAISLPQLERSMRDRSMLMKGLKQVVKELEKSRAICICFYQNSSIALPWHCFTLTIGQFSHSINRMCMFIEKRVRKITINNREEKSYVHYIKRL